MKKNKAHYTLSVLIEKDGNGWFIGSIPALRSCYTQARTIPALLERLEEVARLCLEVERSSNKNFSLARNELYGVQKLELTF